MWPIDAVSPRRSPMPSRQVSHQSSTASLIRLRELKAAILQNLNPQSQIASTKENKRKATTDPQDYLDPRKPHALAGITVIDFTRVLPIIFRNVRVSMMDTACRLVDVSELYGVGPRALQPKVKLRGKQLSCYLAILNRVWHGSCIQATPQELCETTPHRPLARSDWSDG